MKTKLIIIIIFCWIFICLATYIASKETSKKENKLPWLTGIAIGLIIICIIDILEKEWIHILIGIISTFIGICIRRCKEVSEMLDRKKSYGSYYD